MNNDSHAIEDLKRQVNELDEELVSLSTQVAALTDFIIESELRRGRSRKKTLREMGERGWEYSEHYYEWLRKNEPERYERLLAVLEKPRAKKKR